MNSKHENPIIAKRKKLGLTQAQYWNPVGVTQSGGSRYENGREIPQTVQTLLELRYGNAPLKVLAKLRGVTLDQLKAGK